MILVLRRATSDDVARLATDPEWLTDFMSDEHAGADLVDFDKAWHALHYMLCGDLGRTAHPLSVLIGNDENTLASDVHSYGYWVVSPAEVRVFDAALSKLSDSDIAARYDPDAFVSHHLYGADIFLEDGPDAIPYVMRGVPGLRAMSRAAANADAYIISTIF